MGQRGPAPKPTPLRILHGDRRDRINESEPKPTPRDRPPSCPSHLKGDARKLWRRLAPELHRKQLLTDWDLQMLEAWCVQYAIARRAEAEWAQDGYAVTIRSYRGQRVKHPALQTMRDAATVMLSISKRFGFTPADRAGISMPEVGEGEATDLMTPKRVRTRAP